MTRYWMTDSARVAAREDMVSEAERSVCRPVMVIDPEDREHVERLRRAVDGLDDTRFSTDFDQWQAALRSLIAPPKPPEPTGLGAVVEDAGGQRWVLNHLPDGPSWRTAGEGGLWCSYRDIDAVTVLSEGVTS